MTWFALVLAAGVAVYMFVIRPKLREFRATAGVAEAASAASSGWARLRLRLLGLKTCLFGAAGVLTAALPGALEQLRLVDFSAFFSADTALKISSAIMLAMTVTHILGLVDAARIEPRKEDE
ncbi:hypothetical protein [Methylocella sp.]|uniref:hypothetical protein n=1 Tax=Methylocella sp. TaxID=1978226 RepID=UPI0037833F0F